MKEGLKDMKRMTTKQLRIRIENLIIAENLAIIAGNLDKWEEINYTRESLEAEFFARRNYKKYVPQIERNKA